MRRWILIGPSATVVIGAILAFLVTRPPPFDAFPSPPSPSIAPDGTTTFTIDPGTEVNFPAATIQVGDVIICAGKGRALIRHLERQTSRAARSSSTLPRAAT